MASKWLKHRRAILQDESRRVLQYESRWRLARVGRAQEEKGAGWRGAGVAEAGIHEDPLPRRP
eukprot:7202236-Pyramimonas_sp.AAC.1